MKKSVLIAVFLLGIIILPLISAEVRINEIMPHTNSSLHDDWVEIYNPDSSQANLINWIISDGNGNKTFNLSIPTNGFGLIVDDNINYSDGRGCQAVYILLNDSNFSCFQLTAIGNSGLNADGESAILYNNSQLISNFSWTSNLQSIGKSWDYNGTSWTNCTPTPGSANNCTISQTPTCPASFSCSNSSCSDSSLTQTCTNITSNCSNITTTQTLSCTTSNPNSTANASEDLALSWNDEDIINGSEFSVDVKAYNLLDLSYDLKIWLTFYENDTIISDRYDSNLSKWESGIYYVYDFFNNPGNRTKSIKLRLRDDFVDYYGNAKILAKLTKSGNAVKNITNTIEIIKSNSSSTLDTKNIETAVLPSENSSNTEVIDLRIKKSEPKNQNSIIYKSKSEYIKEYTPYIFGGVCILLMLLLALEKGKEAIIQNG